VTGAHEAANRQPSRIDVSDRSLPMGWQSFAELAPRLAESVYGVQRAFAYEGGGRVKPIL
jgi:hypothetical protein